MSNMPAQKPGKSEQVVCTPIDLLDSIKDKLGVDRFHCDLAASRENRVSVDFISEEEDALTCVWYKNCGWLWCNPPYGDIEPWVAKACIESQTGSHVAMLVPASVGSNWWKAYVHNKAYVLFLSPRVTFVGHNTPYPKDLALLLYSPCGASGYDCWRWK